MYVRDIGREKAMYLKRGDGNTLKLFSQIEFKEYSYGSTPYHRNYYTIFNLFWARMFQGWRFSLARREWRVRFSSGPQLVFAFISFELGR